MTSAFLFRTAFTALSMAVAGFPRRLPVWLQRGGSRARPLSAMIPMIGCATMATSAQDTRLDDPSPVPGQVRRMDEDHHVIGGVTLQTSTREISFDAQINQTGGVIEYLLVTEKGKIHESLFSCSISPTNLNVAFKLLAYPESPELFEVVAADHRPTGKFPEVPEETKNGARLVISATWQVDGAKKTCTVNELVKNTSTGQAMPPGPWLYTGSMIHQGVFRAEATGDIIAVFSNPTAMINYPGDARTNDEVWNVNPGPGIVPAKGTPVRITIKPFSKTTPQEPPESP